MKTRSSSKAKQKARKPGRPRKNPNTDGSSTLAVKQRMLDATISLIAERGYDGFALRDVAEAVGVHTALVGYYFESKEKLEQAALEAQIAHAEDVIRHLKSFEHLPPADVLKRFFAESLQASTWQETNYRFIRWTMAKGNQNGMQLVTRICSPVVEFLATQFQRLAPSLPLVECEARAAAFVVLTENCTHMRWNEIQHLKTKSPSDEFLDAYFRLIGQQVLTGIIEEATERPVSFVDERQENVLD